MVYAWKKFQKKSNSIAINNMPIAQQLFRYSWNLVELPFRIKFPLIRKLSVYEFPAISKWQNVGCNHPKNHGN
jgi:hypothetical protein